MYVGRAHYIHPVLTRSCLSVNCSQSEVIIDKNAFYGA